MVKIFHSLFVLPIVCYNVDDFNHKFYHRHSELIVEYKIVKCNIVLKTLLQQGISEPIFYVDLVFEFKRIVGNLILLINQTIIKRYKKLDMG